MCVIVCVRGRYVSGNVALQGLVAGAKDREAYGGGPAVAVLDAKSAVGATAVFVAAQEDNVAALRALLAAKCLPNSHTEAGVTPLYIALQERNTAAVDVLLGEAADVDVNSRTDDG